MQTDHYGLPIRDLPDGRRITIMPLTFERARLGISPTADNTEFDTVY